MGDTDIELVVQSAPSHQTPGSISREISRSGRRHSRLLLAFISVANCLDCMQDKLVDGCNTPFGVKFFYKDEFKPDCVKHDVCYACGSMFGFSKGDCDDRFENDLDTRCKLVADNNTLSLNSCVATSKLHVAGVRTLVVQLHVCLPDLSHTVLEVDSQTPATEIMDMIIDELKLDAREARRALSLWLVSSDLELQLKPNHCPLKLFVKWPLYIKKYVTGDVTGEAAETLPPQLHLRRNVYMDREEDLKVTDLKVLELLFAEARFNVLSSVYPCDKELMLKLAGLLLVMQHGEYDEVQHTKEFFKSLHSILPLSVQSHKQTFEEACNLLSFYHKSTSTQLRSAVKDNVDLWFRDIFLAYIEGAQELPYYGEISADIVPLKMFDQSKSIFNDLLENKCWRLPPDIDSGLPKDKLHSALRRAYLTLCCDLLPFYGSVWFSGYINRVDRSFLQSSWLAVNIGANTDGIFIIDAEKQEPILGILFENLKWEFIDICTCKEPNCPHNSGSLLHASGATRKKFSQKVKGKPSKHKALPSLLLQYPAAEESSSSDVRYKVIRVYTQAARLLDAFIENCRDMMKEKVLSSPRADASPTTDRLSQGDVVDASPGFLPSSRQTSVEASRTKERLQRSVKGLYKPGRLMCQSLSKDGDCIDAE